MTRDASAAREPLAADSPVAQALAAGVAYLPPEQAAQVLARNEDAVAAAALTLLTPAMAIDILWELPADRRDRLIAAAPEDKGAQWRIDHEYPEGTVGRLAVDADNSFAWRSAVSMWIDTSRRTAAYVSIGHVRTSPQVTFVDAGRIDRQSLPAHATMVSAGFAYTLF